MANLGVHWKLTDWKLAFTIEVEMTKFLFGTFACLTLCLTVDSAVGQTQRIQFEFAPFSQYTVFGGQDSPADVQAACSAEEGCVLDLGGVFDLVVQPDGSALIENANLTLSGNETLDLSQFDPGGYLEDQFLLLQDDLGSLGTTYDLIPILVFIDPPPEDLIILPGGLSPIGFGLELEFGVGFLDTSFPDRLVGQPSAGINLDTPFEFNAFLRQVSVTSVPEPTGILLLCSTGIGVALRRMRST